MTEAVGTRYQVPPARNGAECEPSLQREDTHQPYKERDIRVCEALQLPRH